MGTAVDAALTDTGSDAAAGEASTVDPCLPNPCPPEQPTCVPLPGGEHECVCYGRICEGTCIAGAECCEDVDCPAGNICVQSACAPAPMQSVVLQEGVDGYQGTADVWLDGLQNTSYAAATVLSVRSNKEYTSLIRFDVSAIPAGSSVRRARLSLYAYACPIDAYIKIGTYRVLRAWSEQEVTWGYAAQDQPWDAPGCNGVGTDRERFATEYVWLGNYVWSEGFAEWDVTDPVQAWIDDPASNHGLVLSSNTDATALSCRFHSSEAATLNQRPYLMVEFD